MIYPPCTRFEYLSVGNLFLDKNIPLVVYCFIPGQPTVGVPLSAVYVPPNYSKLVTAQVFCGNTLLQNTNQDTWLVLCLNDDGTGVVANLPTLESTRLAKTNPNINIGENEDGLTLFVFCEENQGGHADLHVSLLFE